MDWTKKLFLVVVGCVFTSCMAMAETCSKDAIQKAANEVGASRKHLLATKLDDDMGTSVPPEIQKGIHALKDALANTVSAYMSCQGSDSINPEEMKTTLLQMLAVNEPPKAATAPRDTIPDYGADLQIEISHPPTEPQLLAIKISFAIECGNDSMLMIYERHAGAWQQALRWQSNDYKKISEAFGDFFEYFVLPQPSGKWLVAAAHGTPWCSSRFSAFTIDLIQPIRDNAPQQVLQHMERGYSRDENPVSKLRPDGFELQMNANSLDLDLLTRRVIYRFQLTGNQLERVQPIAMNGRDFVDEWLQVPWAEAKRWSDPANLDNLAKENAFFNYKNNPSRPVASYGPVRGCSDDPKHFQVELGFDHGPTHYFQIQQGDNSFTMLSSSTQPDARCKGSDLMPKH